MKQKKALRRPIVFKIEYCPKLYYDLKEFFDEKNITLLPDFICFFEPYFKRIDNIKVKVKLTYVLQKTQFTEWFDLDDYIYDFWNKYPEKYPKNF